MSQFNRYIAVTAICDPTQIFPNGTARRDMIFGENCLQLTENAAIKFAERASQHDKSAFPSFPGFVISRSPRAG
jgi:hypothetical protein